MSDPALSLEHITHRFGERVAVDDFSLEVARGDAKHIRQGAGLLRKSRGLSVRPASGLASSCPSIFT